VDSITEDGVLMDLGSVAPARLHVATRKDALVLQEHAAEHCTAPYRAPELFEVSAGMDIDERTDVWSLGCTLFAMSYGHGQSPFDGTATSVMSGRIPYPNESSDANVDHRHVGD
jgi:serine/threonine kinase 16